MTPDQLVVESLTVQSLPRQLRAAAIARVRGFVAPGGTLLVIAAVQDNQPDRPDGPWPLTRAETESLRVSVMPDACDEW